MTKNWLIVLLILSILICVVSLVVVTVAICFTINMMRVAPRPLDSFWSMDLGITLIVIFSVTLLASVVGIALTIIKLRA